MTIYQIHEYSGEYEDYRDRIVGSYLKKEKAMARKEELEHIEAERRIKYDHCSSCPLEDEDVVSDDFDVVAKECSMYCRDAKIIEDRYGYYCENYCDYWDEATYDIKEIEVIE
jgi:hypothetical protein